MSFAAGASAYYASNSRGAWEVSVVAVGVDGIGTAVAVTPDGSIVVAYADGQDGSLEAAWIYRGVACSTAGCDGCAPGEMVCGGCVDVLYDRANCGGCSAVCGDPQNGHGVCLGGACQVVCDRAAGYDQCFDGQCQSLLDDPAHCGACGHGIRPPWFAASSGGVKPAPAAGRVVRAGPWSRRQR